MGSEGLSLLKIVFPAREIMRSFPKSCMKSCRRRKISRS
jgi:hypothetical protein